MRNRTHEVQGAARRMAGAAVTGYSRGMKRVAVETFRRKPGEYLRRLLEGEGFELTQRGRVVAELKPSPKSSSPDGRVSLDDLIRAGAATAATRRGIPPMKPLPEQERVSLEEILRDLREDRDAR